MHRFDRGAAKRAKRLRARTQRGHGAVARRRGLHPRPPEDDSQSDTGKFDVPTESEMEDDNEIKMSTLGDKSLWTRRPNTVVHRATFKNDTIVVKRLRANILQSTPLDVKQCANHVSHPHANIQPRFVETGCAVDISELPVRYLPPGSIKDLYRVYSATEGNIKHAKWSTFLRVWNVKWSQVLRFRQISQFAACDDCTQLKAAIVDAEDRCPMFVCLADALVVCACFRP